MSNYLSNRQRNLKVGIESYTENTTSLSVIGNVGIGTTNATTDLDVAGSVKIQGGILDSSSSSGTNNYVVTADGSGGWSWQPVSAGVVTYVDNAGYASTAGIATNLKGGDVGDIPYQSATDTTSFVDASTASSGQVLLYNGSIPIWGNVSAASGAFGGISIQDEGVPVGTANSITTINFTGSSVSVTATSGANGIATVNISSGYASTAGIATNLKGGSGGEIVYQSAADTTAFLSNGTLGQILQSNGGTNPPSWVSAAPADAITGLTIRDEGTIVGGANSVSQLNFVGDIISVASTAGIATITVSNSFTQLSVSGISTLGTVQISSGIVTATSGIVTYYGDGSQLTGIEGGVAISTETSNQAQYIPYATSFGSTTGLGATTLYVFNPATTRLGIGTTNPQYNLQVVGDFAATSKSFVIDHPTKPGKKLRYASLEGPEQGVYVRGRSQEAVIDLPDYWIGLVDEESITVNLTPIGRSATPRVESINQNAISVFTLEEGDLDYYYTVYAERKDIEKLVVEY